MLLPIQPRCVCLCVCMCVFFYVCMCVCLCVYVGVFMCVCLCVFVYVLVCVSVYVYVFNCARGGQGLTLSYFTEQAQGWSACLTGRRPCLQFQGWYQMSMVVPAWTL